MKQSGFLSSAMSVGLLLMVTNATLSATPATAAESPVHDVDVCVYGGTSGGVVAAVQAARMGKSVVLMEPGAHLGGMTSGGLSAVDIGEPRSVGGIAREYFTRLVARYGKTLSWDQPFQRRSGPATGGAYSIEPHVAEQVFDAMAREAGVTVLRNAPLKSVVKDGTRITELVTDDGRRIRARMFIDTTYEGDLMAAAGVTYTVLREGNAKYDESLNGIHYTAKYKPRLEHLQPGDNGRVRGGQGAWDRDFPLDPYVIKGDPTSGLLPLVSAGEPGTPGEPAPGIQAYCFRLCLTSDPGNLIPIAPPPDYDAAHYELVFRFIEACLANGDDMDLRWFSKHDPLPNDKWDFNTATFGGNLPGLSWDWPEATDSERAELTQQLENYHRGLLHFLATDPRVPEKVRKDMGRFGLPKDEFPDNGGWPHQVYIREGRRMVSDLVMTEHHTFGREIAPQSVGLGSYGTDAHEIRRIVKDGVVTREGKIASGRGGFGPYQIGYGAIIPKASECENLLVTFALSASHTAFASIRMEPVLMVTSQSAATAACQAIDASVPVQQIDANTLQQRLNADGQILHWPPPGEVVSEPRRMLRPSDLSGIALDEDAATYLGEWSTSSAARPLMGAAYRHDGKSDRGQKTATFQPQIPQAGQYEVRLLYTDDKNRSSKTPVTIRSAAGESTVTINQRKPALVDFVPRSLGVFPFDAGRSATITISNTGADGYVVVDGLQLVPADLAREQRTATRKSGFDPTSLSTISQSAAAAPRDMSGQVYDLCVIGATPGGVACAVRAAREGLSVLLVNRSSHLGGILSSGLGVWDTVWEGKRSPIYDELRQELFDDYRETYGPDSSQYQSALPGPSGHSNGRFEPHVVERLITQMVEREANITLLTEYIPASASRQDRRIESISFRGFSGDDEVTIRANTYADCTYEGDVLPLAKVAYRVGREGRDEFDEPHAGLVYMIPTKDRPETISNQHWKAHQQLNLRHFRGFQELHPESTGVADNNVQAFNYRTILSSDPDNQLPVTKPADYDPELLRTLEFGSMVRDLPNQKVCWNRPQLIGPHQAYVEGDWQTRQRVMNAHRDATLALLYFLQHDPSVPKDKQMFWQQYGIAKDEFVDNDHRPYEIYVREARRLDGRYVITQRDLEPVPGTLRTPAHSDAIAFTDWYMDSHAVTNNQLERCLDEGKMMLHAETWPGQIPWRCLLPQEIDNLVVPVCLSASHVAWGAIRLEPTWMQTGEAAAFAVSLAKQQQTTPAELDPELLVQTLVQQQFLLSFLNDETVDSSKSSQAAQYFGTQGFFADYDARLNAPLTEAVANAWNDGFTQLKQKTLNPQQLAVRVQSAESASSVMTNRTRADLLEKLWADIR